MIKRVVFSAFGGALFATMLSFGPTINAACQGYCADRQPGGLTYDSCTLTLGRNDEVISVTCFYTGVKISFDEPELELP